MNRAIKYNFRAVLFLALFLAVSQNALAFTYTRTPEGATVNSATLSITDTESSYGGLGFCYNKPGSVYYRPSLQANVFGGRIYMPYTLLADDFTYTVTSTTPINAETFRVGCYDGDFNELDHDWTNIADDFYTITAYVEPPPPPPPPPPRASISFVDTADIEPADMIASVKAGTVDTADKALPLLVFLGIPLGFLLVLMLINMINGTLTPEKKQGVRRGKEVINPNGTDIIYHDLDDLEFKRNYGKRRE